MTEQGERFRFDIYERVLIPDDIPAIASLEEVELKPDVRAIPGREQSQLQGCLELTAVYEAEQQALGKQTFLHRIPVEISLPVRGDAGLIEHIQVKIDEFDVELVTRRSLNVTGVLSLEGWQRTEQEVREDDEGELVAVHDAEPGDAPSLAGDPPLQAGNTLPQTEQTESREELAQAGAESDAAPPKPRSEDELQEMIEAEQQGLYAEKTADFAEEAELEAEEEAGTATEENGSGEEAESPDNLEPKLAFKPAKAPDSDRFVEGTGESASPRANNALQWKSLFLSKEEGTKFSSLRICIVQKEETLQTIAERYQLHPREIELYNRLGDDGISEGQILYIPEK